LGLPDRCPKRGGGNEKKEGLKILERVLGDKLQKKKGGCSPRPREVGRGGGGLERRGGGQEKDKTTILEGKKNFVGVEHKKDGKDKPWKGKKRNPRRKKSSAQAGKLGVQTSVGE